MTLAFGDGFDAAASLQVRRSRQTGRAAEALETARGRLWLTGIVFALAFTTVAARLVDVMVLDRVGEPVAPARAAAFAMPADRADIVDRNGIVLATSLPTASLFADPLMVLDPEEAADRLLTVLPDLDRDRTIELLSSERRFVWLKRDLTPTQQYEINRLGIPGLAFQSEERRYYPLGALTAHIVGFTDIDGHGLAGIERSFDQALAGGEPVTLSIDVRLQELMHEELLAAIEEFRAIGGAGLIMKADTGEILAMVSLPDFNPYDAGTMPPESRFNRATLGVYEMGSTFKIFNTAMALDAGVTTMTGGYDATHPIRAGRFTISDYHGERRWLTVPEIFKYSSNIGSVHMAMDVGVAGQQEFLSRLGLTTRAPVELPEVGAPIVPSPWREINAMTISFGHGIAVSPLQTTAAVAAVINGGLLHPPTLLRVEPGTAPEGTRVVSEETSDNMRRLLRLVVESGTGSKADAEGYLVGGKTGTAEKTAGRGYSSSALLSSFIAAFPMTSPEYVVFAMLDEPHGNASTYGYATGGWVAAPTIRRVIERMGPMVGLAPVDETRPEIVDALAVELPARGGRVAAVADR